MRTSILTLLLAACAPTVPEDELFRQDRVELPWAEELDILVLIDDRPDLGEARNHAQGRFVNGLYSVKWSLDRREDHRVGFVSTYLPEPGEPVRLLGDGFVDDEVEYDGSFPVEGLPYDPDDMMWASMVLPALYDTADRTGQEPAHRAVLGRLLDGETPEGFRRPGAHLAVVIATEAEDTSGLDAASVERIARILEEQPFGSTVFVAGPTPRGCGTMQPAPELRRLAEGTSAIVAEGTCPDMGPGSDWLGEMLEALHWQAFGRQNKAELRLFSDPLPGTLEVYGVHGSERRPLDESLFHLERRNLVMGPPLDEADALEIEFRTDNPFR